MRLIGTTDWAKKCPSLAKKTPLRSPSSSSVVGGRSSLMHAWIHLEKKKFMRNSVTNVSHTIHDTAKTNSKTVIRQLCFLNDWMNLTCFLINASPKAANAVFIQWLILSFLSINLALSNISDTKPITSIAIQDQYQHYMSFCNKSSSHVIPLTLHACKCCKSFISHTHTCMYNGGW